MILETELSLLDSEIASLQALIETKRQQLEVLASAEKLASEALARLTCWKFFLSLLNLIFP
jgi:Tfp pilus assembly protein PilN